MTKRIAYHPAVHPAQPWCVFETEFPLDVGVSLLPKIALFQTKAEAQAAFPDAVVDEKFAWECQFTRRDSRDDEY